MALPEPPYLAVIFSSLRNGSGDDGYDATAERMFELAHEQSGFLGVESARGDDGFGITVSYWIDEEAVRAWRENAEHRIAQERGNGGWYATFALRIARVERSYEGPR
jgi:heme-degrading monooxygenase HmoA